MGGYSLYYTCLDKPKPIAISHLMISLDFKPVEHFQSIFPCLPFIVRAVFSTKMIK